MRGHRRIEQISKCQKLIVFIIHCQYACDFKKLYTNCNKIPKGCTFYYNMKIQKQSFIWFPPHLGWIEVWGLLAYDVSFLYLTFIKQLMMSTSSCTKQNKINCFEALSNERENFQHAVKVQRIIVNKYLVFDSSFLF